MVDKAAANSISFDYMGLNIAVNMLQEAAVKVAISNITQMLVDISFSHSIANISHFYYHIHLSSLI